MKNLDTILSNQILKTHEYAKKALQQDRKTKSFLESKEIFNSVTGQIKTISFNKEWHLRQSYLYNTFRIDYLNEEALKEGLTPIFLTITLPSKYHPLSNNKPNKNYDSSLTVTDGYDELKKVFRSLYNDFKIKRKRVKLKFIRVIEPHKSFIPHLHAIVYVPKAHLLAFQKYFYENIVNLYNLKQVDFKVLECVKYATTYLLKYIDKTLHGDDLIRGWKIHHRITRSITMSNLNNGIDRAIFKVASSKIPFDEENPKNYIQQILDLISIEKIFIYKDSPYRKVNIENNNAIYHFVLFKEKYHEIDDATYDEEINLLEVDIYQEEYKYRDLELKCYDISTKTVIFDSKHSIMRPLGTIDNYEKGDIHLIYEENSLKTCVYL